MLDHTHTEDTTESVTGFPHCGVNADKQYKHKEVMHIQHMDF